ncbi:MAG: protease pro-enzyme activation domain-containing protein [Thermoplasmataceae archaeon]
MNKQFAILVLIIMVLAAFVTLAGNSNAQNAPSLPAQPTGMVSLSAGTTHVLNHMNGITRIGNVYNKQLSVMITLKFRNQVELNNLLSNLNNVNSPLYHKYLTSQEFTNQFSPSASLYNSMVLYYTSLGFSVKTYSDRTSIVLGGSVNHFNQVFHAGIQLFEKGNYQFTAPTASAILPAQFASQVINIAGMNNEHVATLNLVNPSPYFTTSSGSQLLYGSDMQAAYQLKQLYTKYGYPTNETIATILWSGTNSAGTSVAPYVPSDIFSYFNKTLPSGEPHSSVYGAPLGGAPAPGPSAANDNTQADFESTLDLEMAGSAAPGATVVEVYGPQATQTYLDQAFSFILSPSSSYPQLTHTVAISNSWGGTDMTDGTWTSDLQQAAAMGISVFASSGDNGNSGSGGAAPSFPATAAYNTYGATAVGGLATTVSGTASTDGSGTTGISTESVWYNTPNAGDGSQGGVSKVYAEPSWQKASSDANSVITGASATTGVSSGRGVPDVSADGANMEIWISYSGSTGYQELWGTSVASPLTAGLFATMDYAVGHKLGFANPLIYKLAQAEYNGSYSASKPFYFVSNGSNALFSANNGYSLAVGWGSINANNFVNDITSSTPAPTSYPVTFTESGLSSGTSWSVTFNGKTSSSTSTTVSFSAVNGTYSYTIGAVSGYTSSPSSGSVTVNGASQGVSIAFSASSTPPPQTAATYSIVNATSSNIQLYTLPEAEEFTVSKTVTANNVVLYLSGSGTVAFSIGTSFKGTQVLGATNVVVGSTTGWYSTNFANVTLTSGTDYYLNVQLVSGSTQWGYTTSASVDTGAIQDYWYSGSTLTHDNSYPNVYSVGFVPVSSSTPSPTSYPVTFTESGLPSGTSWSVTFNGKTSSSTSTTVSFSVVDGTYSYTIGAVSGYTSSPSSGSVTVNGASQGVSIAFSASSSYPVGTYVIVNATSANIQLYTLGEAEKFTVSSTVTVNNVVMYLGGGSGVISYAIGTTLGGTQIVGTTDVSVGSSSGWVKAFFSHVQLTSGTDYFLTLNLVSGNTQWGYTTSPSVDTGALQDYWYSGSTLEHDNSYPDIFSIGYSSISTAAILGQMFSDNTIASNNIPNLF